MTLPTPESKDELDLQISQMSKSEILAFKEFEKVYVVQHPYPKEDTRYLGWEFWTAMLTSVAALVLAAFRTAQAFYLAAVAKGNVILSLAESISAVFAIEGSVVLFAIQEARENKKTDARSSTWGLWMAFFISVLAGLFQSINIILTPSDTVSSILSWTLVVAMGVGATVIAWLGGDILGVHLVRLELARKDSKDQFTKTVHSYRANMLKEWRNSSEQGAVNKQKNYRYSSTNKVRTNEGNERRERTESRSFVRTNDGSQRDEIKKILDSVLSESGRIAGVTEVAKIIMSRRNSNGSDDGFERLKGNVSQIRKEWEEEKGIIQNGSDTGK